MIRMNSVTQTKTAAPRLIPSLTSGFNLVASRIYLILFPIGLDLLLWFGPHFRLKQLLTPVIQDWVSGVQAMGGAEMVNMVTTVRQLWEVLLERFNLASILSTLPVGVPSLMAGAPPLVNPLGQPAVYEVTSWSQAFSGWMLFGLLGLVLGSLYFGMVARTTAPQVEPYALPRVIWEAVQVLLFTLLLIVLLVLLAFPITLVTTILAMISPGIAQLALMLMSFVMLWLLIPLVFSAHGIFAARQNVVRSMLISARMVRVLFPGVGMFLLTVLVLSQGMGYLWHIPPESSWLMLAGILGNAFISTGLLAASFVYYRGAITWVTTPRTGSK
jgi:hypothetical protein